jgi:hypothetical protein
MEPEAAERTPSDEVHLTRRGIDRILIAIGILATLVFVVAGALLLWGNQFSADYVNDELTSQRITFPPEEALIEEGRDDLVEFAGEDLTTGKQAEAYASYIDGHLQETAGGLTYAELGGVQREARAAVTEATEAGAPQEEIDALQAELDTVNGQRDTLFRGETLRGLLLSAYAWSTVGSIAGYAAIGAFVAAALMAVLVVLGIGHYRKTTHPA